VKFDRAALANPQTWIGLGVVVLSVLMMVGAQSIPSEAGYGGVGPNFLPLAVALGLMVCGVLLVWQALTGGYRDMSEAPPARADWHATAWVSAGVLANALLLTKLGFTLSCALCFVLAVRGLRLSEGKPAGDWRQTLADAGTGLMIAAPVFWLFSKLLAINLPSLTSTGWL
jgi:putative tricarboxylic transport membrane protein